MILAAQSEAFKEKKATAEMLCDLDQLIERKEDEGMYFIWVPLIGDVRTLIMDEAHALSWDVHLRLAEFSYNNSYHSSIRCAPFEALCERMCMSPVLWAEIKESRLIGSELVQETTDKVVLIKEKLKAAEDRQKSYADNRRKILEFEVQDQVLLNVSLWKADANLHVHSEEIKIDKTLHFVEEPEREVKSLKRSKIPIVKVHWNWKRGHEDFIKSNQFGDICDERLNNKSLRALLSYGLSPFNSRGPVVLGWWGEVMWSGKNGEKLGNRRFSGVAGNTVHNTVF
nr:putative reverse transcriptase domain-containing protein [Tanacetum cinerariifolium]